MSDPLKSQVGGDHYSKLAIQPIEYSMANKLDACQHTIIKYVTRCYDKGGIADMEKARHTIDLMIQFEIKKINKVKPPPVPFFNEAHYCPQCDGQCFMPVAHG